MDNYVQMKLGLKPGFGKDIGGRCESVMCVACGIHLIDALPDYLLVLDIKGS